MFLKMNFSNMLSKTRNNIEKKKENKGNYFSDFFISIRSYRPEGAAKHAYNIDHPLKLAIAT